MPQFSREMAPPEMAPSNSAAEEDRRQKLREAGRRKLEEFKRRQLMEMHPDRSAFGNMLAMTQTMAVHSPDTADATSRMVGIPMQQQRSWSASLQPYRITLRSPEQLSQTCRSPAAAPYKFAAGHASSSANAPPHHVRAATVDGRKNPGSLPQRYASSNQASGVTPTLGPGQPAASGQLPNPVRTQAEGERHSATREGIDPAVSPGRDSEMVSMLLQQVSQLQADKQKLQRNLATLEQENANLQELVGFLTDESGGMTQQEGDPRDALDTRQDSGSDFNLSVGESDLDEHYTIMQQEPGLEAVEVPAQERPANGS